MFELQAAKHQRLPAPAVFHSSMIPAKSFQIMVSVPPATVNANLPVVARCAILRCHAGTPGRGRLGFGPAGPYAALIPSRVASATYVSTSVRSSAEGAAVIC